MMEYNSHITAIDLGSSNLVAAVGVMNAEGKLEVKDMVIKPMEGIALGDLANIENVTVALKEALNELGQRNHIEIKEAYISISGKDIQCTNNSYFVYVGSDGEIKNEDLYNLCENMNNVQPPLGKIFLDRFPISYTVDSAEQTKNPVGMFGRRLGATYNFIVAPQSYIDRLNKALDRVDLKCKKFIPTPMAAAYAVTTEDEREMGSAVVNIGSGTTDICIWHDNVIKYMAVIPLGSEAINSDIRSTSIPNRYIEKLKTKHGYASAAAIPEDRAKLSIKLPGRTQKESKIISYYDLSTLIESRMLQIIGYVMDEIKDSQLGEQLAAGIILTGGGAKLNGVDALFKEHSGYEVRLGSIEYDLSEKSVAEIEMPEASTAAGMLFMSFKESNLTAYEEPIIKHITDDTPTPSEPKQSWWQKLLNKTLGEESINENNEQYD
ncbi:MAG: cell division protein FtsA [Tidjanibacter sp.]|nr:cell division protein FtsA [Tidjanibacter sp.]